MDRFPLPPADPSSPDKPARKAPSGGRRLVLAIALVVTLAVTVAAFTWSRGETVMDTTSTLVQGDLPLVGALFDLKISVQREEPILYEYYASADQEQFREAHERNWSKVERGMGQLAARFPADPSVAQVRESLSRIQQHAADLDKVMSQQQIDWDGARAILVKVTEQSRRANGTLNVLMSQVRASCAERGRLTQTLVNEVVLLVAAFSVASVLLLFAALHFLRGYLREAETRRQLALFPERNPHPILSVSGDGTVHYANPGARQLCAQLPETGNQPGALLPADLAQRLDGLAGGSAEVGSLEYEKFGRVFSCKIHHVAGQQLAHVYLLDITEQRRIEQRLHHQAYHDPMTGLPNRYRLDERLAARLEEGRPLCVWLISVDRFRMFVDGFSRRSADAVLIETVQRLSAAMVAGEGEAPGRELFRLDGAQFAVLDTADAHDGDHLVSALQGSMHEPMVVENCEILLTLSIGGSSAPHDGNDADTLYRCADRALQAVRKSGGGNQMRYNVALEASLVERLELETALRRACERNEFVLHFQPQVATDTGDLLGFEALVRWHHPQRGLVPPATFIPLAEETGLINDIGAWVLEQACQRASAWHRAGLRDFTVGVNISARQFRDVDLPALVRRTLESTGLDPGCLDLEITESVAVHDVERTIATLHALKATGVRLSIDDFGTGYSSFAYLKNFPVDRLKIDRSFISRIDSDAGSAALARGVIALAASLGLEALAEGVETEQQRRMLAAFGCHAIQGYLVCRPKPDAELRAFLQPRSAPGVAVA